VLDICQTTRRMTSAGGELTSPNYPHSYPPATDCLCTLSTDDPAASIVLSLHDLVLRTKQRRCRADWLMIRQGIARALSLPSGAVTNLKVGGQQSDA